MKNLNGKIIKRYALSVPIRGQVEEIHVIANYKVQKYT